MELFKLNRCAYTASQVVEILKATLNSDIGIGLTPFFYIKFDNCINLQVGVREYDITALKPLDKYLSKTEYEKASKVTFDTHRIESKLTEFQTVLESISSEFFFSYISCNTISTTLYIVASNEKSELKPLRKSTQNFESKIFLDLS